MKIRVFAQVLVFALLMASVSRPVSAGSPQLNQHSTAPDNTSSQCDQVEAVTPGDTVTDDVSDVSAAHIDITEINTSLSGETLTVVFHLRDLPESLTFHRKGLGEGTMEYRWQVAIDVDNNRETGDGGFDYLLSAYHIIDLSEGNNELTAPIGEIVEASTWEVHPMSFSSIEDASVEISTEADTITLTGQIPDITSESRLTFETFDAQNGIDHVSCLAPFRTYLGPMQCGSGGVAITPGQTVADESGDAKQGYVDIIEVSSSLSGETLTVVFHLRDVPETLTFNRSGIRENMMEYNWEALINVDNDMENGDGGYDYLLSAYHIVRLADKGNNSEVTIEDQVKASIWTMEPGRIIAQEDAGLEVSASEDTITLTGTVPGITSESRLSFRTYNYGLAHDSDSVGCLPSAAGDPAPTPCSSFEALTPGGTATDDVSDVSAAHIDITEINTSLSGETLTVVFHLREVPETLTFDRTGVPDNALEYNWEVAIDVDGSGGYEYTLAARHYVYPDDSGSDRVASIATRGIVQVNTWERRLKSGTLLADASMEVSTQDKTITLSGDIPGITAASRLAFETYDYFDGSDMVECQTSLRPSRFSNACTPAEGAIVPGERVTDGVSDDLAAHIDITEVSTALAGETLAVIFHLKDLPESLVFDRTGVDRRVVEYYWKVLIDLDRNPETGTDGFEYALSASHAVQSRSEGNNAAASIGSKIQAGTWKTHGGDGYMQHAEAIVVVSADANTITLVGNIPGITPDARLEFEAHDFLEGTERVGCLLSSLSGNAE